MRLLISDANVLIDMEDGNLTPAVFRLPYEIAVPDILFDLELKKQHIHLLKAGLQVKSLTAKSIETVENLSSKYPHPSNMDCIALALAMQEQCALLTGDKDLKDAATKEGVEAHGTLWVVEQLVQGKILKVSEAQKALISMKEKGSRLPSAIPASHFSRVSKIFLS